WNPAAKPQITTTGTTVRAIGCISGVTGISDPLERTYTMKLPTVTASDSPLNTTHPYLTNDTVGYGTRFYFHSVTEASKPAANTCTPGHICFRYRTNGTNPTCNQLADTAYNVTDGIRHTPGTAAGTVYRVIACDGDDQLAPSDVFEFNFPSTLVAP